ncbi:glutathione S-transferase family protein [Limnofasciculus baicalensis]|uniref:Glutathione S-transferase family protein n=1 Tax=Limnofasciculus baicalensis BBK-W-15 TaxID=2699891 RepID=A0AAE3GVX3_9CYAN|nr:glutathione S-transferase family protein [Limnofasciculus baicalensis]MCP2731666.1 glutathione S-transferase family protein [Limnofasciculus baicalensis BBK-W-15]
MTKLTLILGNKNYSSWSLRPWLLMKQFKLDFDEVIISLYNPESKPKIQQYSPSGKVPVLLHDEITIWDSLAICEYLTEQFPNYHGLPEDKKARAIARSISAEMHSGFPNLRQNMPMNCRAKLPRKVITSEVQQDINRITDIWRYCRGNFGSGGDMLFGKFAIADAMFAPVVLRFITYSVELDSVCKDYANAILALPAMKEWIKAAESEPEIIPSFEL